MRIAFYADNFYPELSGIVDSILITGKELTKRGHAVAYVGPRYGTRDYELVTRPLPDKPEQLKGMPVVRLPSVRLLRSPTGQSRIAFPTGASLAFMREFKPNIVHTHSPYGTGLEALRIARALRIPLVGTNHTPVEEFYRFAPNAARRFDAWYYNHCAYVSTPYAALLERMRQKSFTRPGRAVPNPIELPLFYPATPKNKNKLRQEMGLSGPILLYSGRLASEKRVDIILKGVKLLTRSFSSLTFVATGLGIEFHNLHKLARELSIEQHVRFTGFVPQDEMARYYRTADVFAMLSTADSQSLSLMQAYSSGLPAVCARARGLPDYTPSECGVLVEPGDPAAFAREAARLLRDEILRERMGKAGVEFVAQFAPAKIAAQWEEIYSEVISRSIR